MSDDEVPIPIHVVGDVHGHRAELATALTGAGFLDEDGRWSAGTARLWFLGDFVDRGPDGIGTIDLVMALEEQAREAGGQVATLLGNHEILLLGMRLFGETEVPSGLGPRSFARSWALNGGQQTDQDGLTDAHVEWLTEQPVLALVDDHLLMHSDTLEYLSWGDTIDEINAAVRDVLESDDIVAWWEVWRRMTARHAFRGTYGEEIVDKLLSVLGGHQVVHGHSVIADQLGILPSLVDGPLLYAGGKALGVDGGVFVGGPCLVVPLPFTPGEN
ncbi:metallophosphoesterase family protein [Actinophytocola sp.]|uniref:metallophosphoesterase family protein n=1 Tax=Actinophytocola sp. TaxID=1872138 RepID=UPI002D7E14FB|nr:metallophosphoesterase family protein [Actinophytocola sp.]HET9139593.1 metallophosphoesterase family protein [Actinophytocola sp.]